MDNIVINCEIIMMGGTEWMNSLRPQNLNNPFYLMGYRAGDTFRWAIQDYLGAIEYISEETQTRLEKEFSFVRFIHKEEEDD